MSRKPLLWLVVVAVLAAGLAVPVYRSLSKQPEAAESPVPVEVMTVSKGDIEQIVAATGVVEAIATVNIMPKVSGRIESLAVDAGDGKKARLEEGVAVHKGQVIALIDQELFLAQVSGAKATVMAAQANLKSAEAEAADAQREKQRMVSLFGGGSISEQAKDKALTAADMTAAKVKAAEAQLAQARAALELAEINLRESEIKAPINGVVTRRGVDEGNLISAGQMITTIADVSQMKVIVGIPEKYQSTVKEGVASRLVVDAWPGKVFPAAVRLVYPALDAQTRSLQVEIRLDNPAMELKPGMFARVDLVAQKKGDAIVVPADVVLGGKVGPAYVYTVKDGVAHKKTVETGIKQGERLEVISGLDEGETLVVNGMTYIKDGSSVGVVTMEAIK